MKKASGVAKMKTGGKPKGIKIKGAPKAKGMKIPKGVKAGKLGGI